MREAVGMVDGRDVGHGRHRPDPRDGAEAPDCRIGLAAIAASARCRGCLRMAVAHYIRNASRARASTTPGRTQAPGGWTAGTLCTGEKIKAHRTAGRTSILRRYFPRHASPRRCRAVAHRARGRSADRSRGHRAGTSAERLLHLARPEEPGDASGLRREGEPRDARVRGLRADRPAWGGSHGDAVPLAG